MTDASMPGGPAQELDHDRKRRFAYETTFLAHERTQLAWLRTGLSMISFGFAIAKIFEYLHEKHGKDEPWLGARTVGLLMISLGVVSLISATFQHMLSMKRLRKEQPDLPMSLSGWTSGSVGLLGLLGLIAAILRQ